MKRQKATAMGTQTRKPVLTSGIVIGTRKAGTTWLYENFRQDPRTCVSHLVKESGYFTGNMKHLNFERYQALFDPDEPGRRIEVDSSVCCADKASMLLECYNPAMRVVLIFRDPAEFLQSRHVHSLRKGELKQTSPLDAYHENEWLQRELDYPAIVARFQHFDDLGTLTILTYEELRRDPIGFYAKVIRALGAETENDFSPSTEPMNVSRSSRLRLFSATLSQGAFMARGLGLHRLVNILKSTGIHRVAEVKRDKTEGPDDNAYRDAVAALVPDSVRLHWTLCND